MAIASKGSPKLIKPSTAERQSRVFAALSHPLRLRLMQWMGGQERSFHAIQDTLSTLLEQDLMQSSISHHLRILRDVGLVTCAKRGRDIFYCVNPDALVYARNMLKEIEKGESDA